MTISGSLVATATWLLPGLRHVTTLLCVQTTEQATQAQLPALYSESAMASQTFIYSFIGVPM